MYIPLGGRDTRMVNIWLIFLFVSIWHDIEAKLVIWGLLNASFYILEILGGMLIKSDTILNNLSTSFIKLLGLFSAATYIIILIFVLHPNSMIVKFSLCFHKNEMINNMCHVTLF